MRRVRGKICLAGTLVTRTFLWALNALRTSDRCRRGERPHDGDRFQQPNYLGLLLRGKHLLKTFSVADDANFGVPDIAERLNSNVLAKLGEASSFSGLIRNKPNISGGSRGANYRTRYTSRDPAG